MRGQPAVTAYQQMMVARAFARVEHDDDRIPILVEFGELDEVAIRIAVDKVSLAVFETTDRLAVGVGLVNDRIAFLKIPAVTDRDDVVDDIADAEFSLTVNEFILQEL